MEELQKTKENYEDKIVLLNTILEKIDNPLRNIDNDLMELIKNVIKNAIRKIILKDIQEDPTILTNMIDELKLLINPQDSLIVVYLSESDFNNLDLKAANTTLSFKMNRELMDGDIIIKSNTAEVRSILNDRIDKMIGIKK